MKAYLWFENDQTKPTKSGYYLTFVGATMGGGEPSAQYSYFDKKKQEWRDYESSSMSRWQNVVYWTEADPFDWYENSSPNKNTQTEAEKLAWQNVINAVEQYNIVKGLTNES